jgi:hypothetical protein
MGGPIIDAPGSENCEKANTNNLYLDFGVSIFSADGIGVVAGGSTT